MGFFRQRKGQSAPRGGQSRRGGQAAAGGLQLVAGLGNPGPEYVRSRHNAGFMAAIRFLARHELGRPRTRYGGRWTEGDFHGSPVAVLMPQTFMNCSGDSVGEAAVKKHIAPERIIVAHDDLDFPFGTVRCRSGGGSGGHNGLASVTSRLGSPDFLRVRIGIGRPDDPTVDPREWVLTEFDAPDEELLPVIDRAVDCIETILLDGIEAAMREFNRREKDQPAP
jgi:PTH1 family peptidyl-tRNA hydrolase